MRTVSGLDCGQSADTSPQARYCNGKGYSPRRDTAPEIFCVLGCSVSAYLDKGSDNYISLKKVMLRMIFSSRPPVAHILISSEKTRSKQRANKAQRKKPLHRYKIISQKESAVSRARQGGLLKLLGGSPLFAVLASPRLGEKRFQRGAPSPRKSPPLDKAS